MSEPTDADKATDLLPLLCPNREDTATRIVRALADAREQGRRDGAEEMRAAILAADRWADVGVEAIRAVTIPASSGASTSGDDHNG